MKETIPALVLLALMAAGCWFFVINKRLRKNFQRPTWRLYKLGQEQKEMYDALYLAGALVGAIFFTIFFVVACVLAILRNA